MIVLPSGWNGLLQNAVSHYWKTLATQSAKQKDGDADRGGRSAVTGGKHMNGFCELVNRVLIENDMPEAHIHVRKNLELPGYFRPTKEWDMLVVNAGHLIAAIELKSQRGPSFGNNFNNRTEEALGNATDLWTAYREGAFGQSQPRPWLGWVMLLEDCKASRKPVGVAEPHFPVASDFRGASYAKRYELLLQKLLRERLYDGAAFVMSTEAGGTKGDYTEPNEELTFKRFLIGLASHVSGYAASL